MINWTSVLSRNSRNVRSYATGGLSLKDLMHVSHPKARRELRTKIERGHGAQYGRRLARKALRRRGMLI